MIDTMDMGHLIDGYYAWLKDRTAWRQVGDFVEITTPYLDRHNDYLQVFLRQTASGYDLTDDGATIEDLRDSGCDLDTPRRRRALEATLAGFGVRQHRDALVVSATPDTFALRKHSLVQAMLAVNDLFYLATPSVASFFAEDVASWLDKIDARYTPRVKFAGKTGYDHLFDFVVPRSRHQPERLLRVINHPGKTAAEAAILAWHDTREARPERSLAFAMLNDAERTVSPAVADALKAYEIRPVLWTDRDSVRSTLAA